MGIGINSGAPGAGGRFIIIHRFVLRLADGDRSIPFRVVDQDPRDDIEDVTQRGLVFGFPVRSNGSDWEIVQGLEHGDFARSKLATTQKELEDEREAVASMIS